MNPNRFAPKSTLRPLASIPNKDGFTLIGVRADGTEAELTVYFDRASGIHTVPGYNTLTGWKMP